jgi:hypothetical protein
MNNNIRAALGCAVVLLIAVPAAAQPRDARRPAPCLRQIDMYSFDAVPGNRSLIVEDRRHQRYRVNLQGICNGLQFKLGLRFKTFGTSNLTCLSRGDQVLQRDPLGPSRCIIRDIQYQTPDMDRDDMMARQR